MEQAEDPLIAYFVGRRIEGKQTDFPSEFVSLFILLCGFVSQFVIQMHNRLIDAELDLLTEPADILSALNESVEMARKIELQVRADWEVGKRPTDDLAEAMYFRIEMEIRLLRAKKQFEATAEKK